MLGSHCSFAQIAGRGIVNFSCMISLDEFLVIGQVYVIHQGLNQCKAPPDEVNGTIMRIRSTKEEGETLVI